MQLLTLERLRNLYNDWVKKYGQGRDHRSWRFGQAVLNEHYLPPELDNVRPNDLNVENAYDVYYKLGSLLAELSQLEFARNCDRIKTCEDVFALAKEGGKFRCYKDIWNDKVGWGLPSELVCNKVLEAYNTYIATHPEARLVDFGAGSGIFSWMFCEMGIPADKIIAVDLPNPTHPSEMSFWKNIIRNDQYVVDKNDILFISWGFDIQGIVDDYVSRGGKRIIIIGEQTFGCTFPSDYFEEDESWSVDSTAVLSVASTNLEYITINTRLS